MKEKDGDIRQVAQNPVFNMQGSSISTMVTSTTFSGSITISSAPNFQSSGEISKEKGIQQAHNASLSHENAVPLSKIIGNDKIPENTPINSLQPGKKDCDEEFKLNKIGKNDEFDYEGKSVKLLSILYDSAQYDSSAAFNTKSMENLSAINKSTLNATENEYLANLKTQSKTTQKTAAVIYYFL